MLLYLILAILFVPPLVWLFTVPFRIIGAIDGWRGKCLGSVVLLTEIVGVFFLGKLVFASITFGPR